MNEDFEDLLACLLEEEVRFLVVGAHALAVHGVPRATGDLDVWIEPGRQNAEQAWAALARFGAPLETFELSIDDLTRPGTVFQLGLPPRRIDVLTQISGVDFASAWESRVVREFEGMELSFLGRAELLENKRASGRPKDLADVAMLEELDAD